MHNTWGLYFQVGSQASRQMQPFEMCEDKTKLAVKADWLRQLQVSCALTDDTVQFAAPTAATDCAAMLTLQWHKALYLE